MFSAAAAAAVVAAVFTAAAVVAAATPAAAGEQNDQNDDDPKATIISAHIHETLSPHRILIDFPAAYAVRFKNFLICRGSLWFFGGA